MKLLAVGFILMFPSTFVINFQLGGGVWILQTLPLVFLAAFWRWLDGRAIACGWALGMAWGTYLLVKQHFTSAVTTLHLGSWHPSMYIGIPTLTVNLAVVLVGTTLARWWRHSPLIGSRSLKPRA